MENSRRRRQYRGRKSNRGEEENEDCRRAAVRTRDKTFLAGLILRGTPTIDASVWRHSLLCGKLTPVWLFHDDFFLFFLNHPGSDPHTSKCRKEHSIIGVKIVRFIKNYLLYLINLLPGWRRIDKIAIRKINCWIEKKKKCTYMLKV